MPGELVKLYQQPLTQQLISFRLINQFGNRIPVPILYSLQEVVLGTRMISWKVKILWRDTVHKSIPIIKALILYVLQLLFQ